MTGILIQEGPKPRIIALIKFINSRWVEAFRAGKIRMGSVAGFRKEQEEDLGRRHDMSENLSAVYQPDQITLKINNIKIDGLAGPVEMRRDVDDISYLFCMTAITDRALNAANGSLQLDPRLTNLGDRAVVVHNVAEFSRRLSKAIDGRVDLGSHGGSGNRGSGLVEYIDLSNYQGDVGPFRKSDNFKFQHEWRLALLDRHEKRLDQLFLEVGDLYDITSAHDSTAIIESKIIVHLLPDAESLK